ncbi:HTH-type transcriptional regulator PksA [Lentibacillus populi]|uniref:HTH-type transcriptional regulator PksA n=1 Tax=Lentibacillus populi TaxID=1827502 RepID=A0A9W5TY29_9BACI|nr:TetR/AcrR family transcriptional regulator [Lentibacillus populi]GGB44728.1 HTH-type transcriptional regulator PksA [Lentibacillus populi]
MPKIVDHDKRKIKIAETTWKVIIRDGLEQASVRKIANAASLSVGALRHYFSTQSELFQFSMKLVADQVKQRIARKNYDGEPLDVMKEIVSELLPVDEDRRIEMEVWLVFSTRTLVDPSLKQLSQTVYKEIRHAATLVIEGLINLQLAKDDLNKELEIERLYALVDGLALHALLHPDQLSIEKMQDTIKYHLESLCNGNG